jgi:hypothetical protein
VENAFRSTASRSLAPGVTLAAALLLGSLAWFELAHLWVGAFPPPLFLLAFEFMGVPHSLACLAAALLFLAWAPQLLWGSAFVPWHSRIGLGLLTAITLLNLFSNWSYAVGYRGWLSVLGIALVTTAPIVMLWWQLRRSLQAPSFQRSLALHAGMMAWLLTLAFPLLGELP